MKDVIKEPTEPVIPLQVIGDEGRELFRVTREGEFVWGADLKVDETARILADTITSMLRRG